MIIDTNVVRNFINHIKTIENNINPYVFKQLLEIFSKCDNTIIVFHLQQHPFHVKPNLLSRGQIKFYWDIITRRITNLDVDSRGVLCRKTKISDYSLYYIIRTTGGRINNFPKIFYRTLWSYKEKNNGKFYPVFQKQIPLDELLKVINSSSNWVLFYSPGSQLKEEGNFRKTPFFKDGKSSSNSIQ